MTPERLQELRDLNLALETWCHEWMYVAIRHVIRNEDLGDVCSVHGEYQCPTPDRNDGASIAVMREGFAELLAYVDELTGVTV